MDTCRVSSALGHSEQQAMPPPFLPPFPPPLRRPSMPKPAKAEPPKPKPPKPKPSKPKPPKEVRARIIGDWLQTEARYLA